MPNDQRVTEMRAAEFRRLFGDPDPEPPAGDFPIHERCGCGWGTDTPVQFHRRGTTGCRAEGA